MQGVNRIDLPGKQKNIDKTKNKNNDGYEIYRD
jgi:hypothetical protein